MGRKALDVAAEKGQDGSPAPATSGWQPTERKWLKKLARAGKCVDEADDALSECMRLAYEAGVSTSAIARELVFSTGWVREKIRRSGGKLRPPGRPRNVSLREKRKRDADICRQYGRGISVGEIAAEHGLTTVRIYQIATRGGVHKPKKRRRAGRTGTAMGAGTGRSRYGLGASET